MAGGGHGRFAQEKIRDKGKQFSKLSVTVVALGLEMVFFPPRSWQTLQRALGTPECPSREGGF